MNLSNLKNDSNKSFRLIECNLYKILLDICEEKRILKNIPTMEEQRGKSFLVNQLQKIATPEAFVEKMQYKDMQEGDILLITGVGEVYPYMRSHKILDNLQEDDLEKCLNQKDQSYLMQKQLKGKIEVELYAENKKELIRIPSEELDTSTCIRREGE